MKEGNHEANPDFSLHRPHALPAVRLRRSRARGGAASVAFAGRDPIGRDPIARAPAQRADRGPERRAGAFPAPLCGGDACRFPDRRAHARRANACAHGHGARAAAHALPRDGGPGAGSCDVYAYDKGEGGIWVKALGFSGFVGEKGVSSAKREGDKRTPAGIFRLGFAFGSEETPNPDYPFRAVTQESFWVDDPDSRFYNQWVEGEAERDWSSAERLANSPTAYALAVVVEYNYGQEAEPGKGSAIFLHVGDEPTSGCIALEKADLTALVQWLDEDASPRIVIAQDG